ncbi:MAG TPA: hypothetical protein VK177_08380 [Flavobacteriales bacterium]|nr:hypothetical protein [Flavobacteriales bacterium]
MRAAIVFVFLGCVGCSEKTAKIANETNSGMPSDTVNSHVFLNETGFADTCFKPTDENELPPFKYNCPCDLYQFGEHKTSDSTRHIYLRGKHWNPHLNACTFAFYEGAYNTSTEGMKAVKIHLLDVDNFSIPAGDSEYGNNDVKDKVVLVFYRTMSTKDTVINDPFKTGKYNHD